jgi:hypothetical protein
MSRSSAWMDCCLQFKSVKIFRLYFKVTKKYKIKYIQIHIVLIANQKHTFHSN